MQVDALTAREREVLGLMRAGLLGKQIAERLGISLHTVAFHRGNLWQKLRAGGLMRCRCCGAELGVRDGAGA